MRLVVGTVVGLLALSAPATHAQLDRPSQLGVACARGEVLVDGGGGTWTCAPDHGRIDSVDQLEIAACRAGELLCWDGAEWDCCARTAPAPIDFSADPALIGLWSFDDPTRPFANSHLPGTFDLEDDLASCDGVVVSAVDPVEHAPADARIYAVFEPQPAGCAQLTAAHDAALDPAPGSVSFGCWVRLRGEDVEDKAVAFGKLSRYGASGWGVIVSFNARAAAQLETQTDAGPLSDLRWHHVGVTYAGDQPGASSGSLVATYLDGRAVATGSVPDGVLDPTGYDLNLGASAGHDRAFRGDLDNCFLIARRLSSAELCSVANFGLRGDAAVSRRLCP